MNSGEEVFYSQTRLSTPGRPQLSSFILALTDSATPRGSNVSLFSEVNQQPSPTDVTQTNDGLRLISRSTTSLIS